MFASFCVSKLTLLKKKMFGTVDNLFAVFCCSGIELFVIMFTVLQKMKLAFCLFSAFSTLTELLHQTCNLQRFNQAPITTAADDKFCNIFLIFLIF